MKVQKLFNLISILALLLGLYIFFFNKHKTVCLDTAKVLSSYSGIIEAGKALQVRELELKAKSDTLAKEFEIRLKDFEKNRSGMTDLEIAKANDELKMMQNQYSQFSSANEEKFKKEQYQLTEKAINEVNVIIASYAKEKGYEVVLGANNSGSVLFVNEKIDITEEIIRILKNKK